MASQRQPSPQRQNLKGIQPKRIHTAQDSLKRTALLVLPQKQPSSSPRPYEYTAHKGAHVRQLRYRQQRMPPAFVDTEALPLAQST
eukprot:scaffold130289_cov50-Tisochrysis_lutea.AAC.2